MGLGRALEGLGDKRGAVEVYSRLPNDADAVEALARLVEADDPEQAAGLYKRLQTLSLGEPWPYLYEARARAHFDPLGALESFKTYQGLINAEPDGDALVALAVALKESGHEPEAAELLNQYKDEWPEGGAVQEARGRLERWAVEHAARELAIGGDQPLSADALARVEAARRQAARGADELALAGLRELAREYPRSAEVWAALGDVHSGLQRYDEAELAYGWAVALAPEESAWHARLGLLLAEAWGGRRNREASESLTRALALRPSWSELRYHLAVVNQLQGRFDDAVRELRAYLAAEPTGPLAEDARARLAALTRPVHDPPDRKLAGSCPEHIQPEVCDQYRVARIYQDRGDLGAARHELDSVLAAAPKWAAALNLLAALELEQDHPELARAAWRRSLSAEPDQPQVLLALGDQARREGRSGEALDLLQQAAALGAGEAWYSLAEISFAAGRIDEAQERLDAYFSSANSGLQTDKASALRAEIQRQIRQKKLAMAVAAGTGLLIALGGLAWRRSGRTLPELLERAPEAVHDLARVVSALRHEVLKHNTTLLSEVASALERGDNAAVEFAATRLFGPPETHEGGIVHRFDGYLASLDHLGRQHGVRLDLRRKDPVIAPMAAAMRRLRRLERDMRRPWRARRSLSHELRVLSHQLNVTCYQALGRFLREMSTLRITAELIQSVDAGVRAEPAFSGQALPPLQLEVPEGGLPARILRGDLQDIIANLLRNAYRAVGEGLTPERRRVGLTMEEEVDMVTGLEAVVLRFRDNAPGKLTSEMIRTRSSGRGLGLVVDLVTRHNGGVTVEREPGWAKAVVVRLPRAEAPESEDPEDSTAASLPLLSSSPSEGA